MEELIGRQIVMSQKEWEGCDQKSFTVERLSSFKKELFVSGVIVHFL